MRTLPLFLLLAACPSTDDGAAKAGDDTASADTDADTDADTGKGEDTSKEGDTDTDTDADTDSDTDADTDTDTDTAPPAPAAYTGYLGPTRIALLVDGATGSGLNPSSVVLYDPATGTSSTVSGLTVRGDALLDCAGDAVFVLESRGADGLTDRILRVDPTAATYAEWNLGSNFQPRDVALVLDEYWVANWGKSRLSTFDADGTAGPFFSLDAYADADGIPEANGIFVSGPTAYVTLARQSADGTQNGAKVLEIALDSKTVTRSADLAGNYPSGKMLGSADALFVHLRSTPSPDGSLATDGGVERVETAGFTSEGLFVEDATAANRQTAASLDPFQFAAWFGRTNSSGAAEVAAVALLDGTPLQTWPVADQVTGIGAADGTLWTAETPFTGGSSALVGREPFDGTETTRVAQSGVVRGFATCVQSSEPVVDTGTPPE